MGRDGKGYRGVGKGGEGCYKVAQCHDGEIEIVSRVSQCRPFLDSPPQLVQCDSGVSSLS